MLQSLSFKGFEKVKKMFIITDQKIKTKFGKVVGKCNTKEFVRTGNFKPTIFGEVFSIKFQVLNIKNMLSY